MRRVSGMVLAMSLLLMAAVYAHGQTTALAGNDKAAFTVLSIKDGLPNSSVSGIVQDRRGFL